jgi:predicted metal-dependent phosphotriesterase family hydrolase
MGQVGNPLHPDGLQLLFDGLKKQGFTQEEIDQMSKVNPARLLGLQ